MIDDKRKSDEWAAFWAAADKGYVVIGLAPDTESAGRLVRAWLWLNGLVTL